MAKMQDERKITRYIIGAAVLGYGLLMVLLAVFFPAHEFFYADIDCLSLLHAKGFFHQLTYDGVSPMPVPHASLNLVLSLILWLGLQSPLSPTILRVGGQITLFALFLLTLVRVLPDGFKEKNRPLFFLLLAIHPLFWGISLFSIHVLLTIWLFFLVLLCYSNISSHPFMVGCAIWLLSCSGMEGFWLAVLFVAYIVVKDGVMADTRRQRKGILLLLSGLLPAFCFYAGLSLLSGQLGGPYVGSAFSPTAGYVMGTLLSGAWGETFRAFLVFVGNGFLSLPFIFPLFGILAFLGFFEVCQWKPRTFRVYGFLMFGLAAVLAISMANVGVNQSWRFLSFLGLAGCVILGIRQIEFSLKGEGIWTRGVLLAVLGSLGMVSAFTTLPAQWSKALAYRQIRDTIQPAEARQVLARDEKPAVQFTPILYANLAQPCSYYPFLYKIGVRETGKAGAAAPKSYRFARVDNPPFIAIYNPAPDMDWLQSDAVQHGTFITAPYRRFYKRTIQPGIVFYERTLPKPFLQDWASVYASLDGPPLFQRTFMQTIDEYASFPSPPDFIPPTPGMCWDFEGGYRNVRQEGIAFGLEPDFSDSAVGVGCAGPGAAGRESLMGTLESVPFSLQGDEFCFSAAIPNSVTANLFCLAVWQRQSWGPGREVTQTAPIFDRLRGEPLLADTFYYIKPEDLRYQEGWVQGWRVIHALHEAESADWQTYRWPLDGWRNQQAIWLCADRDRSSAIRIDHLFQSRRPPGYYWNFEDGAYQGWEISGTAFGDTPAMERYGNQSPIRGYEGNYFVNSFYQGSDRAHGKLLSPVFPIPEGGLMVFRIGGGNDWDRTYLEFEVNGVAVKRATGNRSEILEPVVWDLRTWAGKPGRIRIVDESHDAWGHILIDDIRVYASPADT